MSTVLYNCPCCGAPLNYNGASGKLECASCANSYDTEDLAVYNEADAGEGINFERPEGSFSAEEAGHIQAYKCSGCGAELVTDDTTTATECPYCGSPVVLPDRIENGVRPEKVVPFVVEKEEARKMFEGYFKGKALIPNIFLNGRNRIAEMRKLYVPYWLFDCSARANMVFEAEKQRVERRGEWEFTHTDHYLARRNGGMSFADIPVDGIEKLDNAITESLEPYNIDAAVPFSPAVLAGAMADNADAAADKCEERAVERVRNSVRDAMRSTVTGYTSVSERSCSISTENGKATPVLMPAWIITTEKEGKTYTFAINGQTGKLTCDVPADKKKSFIWGAGVFAVAFAIISVIMYFADMLASGTLLVGGVVSLVISLIVLSVLKGQLKQAVSRYSAGDYMCEGSFGLTLKHDSFLYTKTTKRRIENGGK